MTARQAVSNGLTRHLRASRSFNGIRRYTSAAVAVSDSSSSYSQDPGPSFRPPTRARSSLFPQKPVKEKPRERVAYKQAGSAASSERRAFFADGDKERSGWEDAEVGETIPGLEAGRVVECRRSGSATIGLILGSVLSNGRQRLLILRSSGEIWPVSLNDVQFAMPASLVSPGLAARCWSTDLMAAWAKGEEAEMAEDMNGDLLRAMREVALILRKVSRETEKMMARLCGPGRNGKGGAEAVWEEWIGTLSEDQRGTITPAAAAEFILRAQAQKNASPVSVRDNTLPAYAAHCMLMQRSDLFVGDEGQMWEHGVFMVRSRAERARILRLKEITSRVESHDTALGEFVQKSRRILAESLPAPVEWSETDKLLIHGLLMRLYETRTTQHTPYEMISVAILRAVDPYPGEVADLAMVSKFVADLGVWSADDSLQTSRVIEAEKRSMTLAGLSADTSRAGLLKGDELDTLREDFSSHRVWVIDDSGAVELDDGISLSRVHGSKDIWVHVHVADPTRILPVDHPLAVQASFRGSALYLAEGNTPLLPLAQTMGSLHLGATDGVSGGQGVLVLSALLDSQGGVKDTKVQLGWIKSPRLTTYAAVDEALGIEAMPIGRPFGAVRPASETAISKPPVSTDLDDLNLLHRIAQLRRARRVQNGAMDWNAPSASISLIHPSSPCHNIFDPVSTPSSTHPLPPSPIIDYTVPLQSSSRPLTTASAVAEVMMLAGRVAAMYCQTHALPAPYRGAGEPRQLLLPGRPNSTMTVQDLMSHRDADGSIDPFIAWKSRVAFPPSTITTFPQDHWNMGFIGPEQGYIRATSPLRRFDDLLVHWQIKNHLARSRGLEWGSPIEEADMAILNRRVEAAQRRSKRAAVTSHAYWQAGLFGQKLLAPCTGEEGTLDIRAPLQARIAGMTAARSGIQSTPVLLPALGAMAVMSGQTGSLEIGDSVTVRMVRAVQRPTPFLEVVAV